GFFVAAAIGFLGTMLPRRTDTGPLSTGTLASLVAATVLSAAATLGGKIVVAEIVFLGILGLLGASAVRRLRAAKAPPPPSFVLVAAGGLLGALGAILLGVAGAGGPALALRVGRALASQGTMLCLVLAVAPILVPALLGVAPRPASMRRHLGAAVLVAASF